MKIMSETRESSIEINKEGVELAHLPSIKVNIEVKDCGFSGQNKEVWIELSVLNNFVEQLRDCEKKRFGKAFLKSMSPEEFQLTIVNKDASGHFSLIYALNKYKYNSTQMLIKQQVSGEFDLDSEYFSQIVDNFLGLLP